MANEARNKAAVLKIETSSVFLPQASTLRRLPRAPKRKRPQSFWDRFEDKALFYDCFSFGPGQVVLCGPPPGNLFLHHQRARYMAWPSKTILAAEFFPSRSTMTTALRGVPEDTESIDIAFGEERFVVPVQPRLEQHFSGARVLFTMNKDNPLPWIARWADWHVRLHGVDTIVVFDNSSTAYGLDALGATLGSVEGLKTIGLVDWPFRYGPIDPAVLSYPYWPNFLQVAGLSVMVRRLGAASAGVINCDIDELVGRGPDGGVFETLAQSRSGFIRLKGNWIEPVKEPSFSSDVSHLAYRHRHINPLHAVCADKWALDPRRAWVQPLNVFPMMHRIYGMPKTVRSSAPRLPFWHFKGINTNWKYQRNRAGGKASPWHVADKGWIRAMSDYQGRLNEERRDR